MTTSAFASRSISSPSVSPAYLAGRSDAGHGFVLFRRDSILLDPRDVLVVYSDGLTQAQPELLMDRSALAVWIDDTTSAAGIADRLTALGRAAGPLTDDVTIAVLRHSDPRQSTGNGSPTTSTT